MLALHAGTVHVVTSISDYNFGTVSVDDNFEHKVRTTTTLG